MPSTDPVYLRLLKQAAYRLGALCPLRPHSVAQGVALCRTLSGEGFGTTLGRLSKFGDDPLQIVREYQEASNTLAAALPGTFFYLSLKPPALDFDPGHATLIAQTALANGHGVHLDSHKFAQADATFELLEELLRRRLPGRPAGWCWSLSLPSRWRRSLADARWAVRRGVRVRLVKGNFPAPAGEEVAAVPGFLALVDLLAGEAPELALATHDEALARESVARCRRGGSRVELELFFGRPATSLLRLARETGTPLGFYVPYGETLLVYAFKDLLTNPLKLVRRDALELLGTPERKLARICRDR